MDESSPTLTASGTWIPARVSRSTCSWHSFGDGIQIEGQVRLGLVPVRHGGVVVGAFVCMSGLDAVSDGSHERHGVVDLEMVLTDLLSTLVDTSQGDALTRPWRCMGSG